MNPDDFRRLVAAGLNNEQIAIVMEVVEAAQDDARAAADAAMEASREKGRERWRRWDEKRRANVGQREQTLDDVSKHSRERVTRVEDKTSNLEIEPQKEERNALTREFDLFWAEYPNKVGKPKAKAAFSAARKRADAGSIIAGLRRYVATKPSDRAWLNPATFLNQDRWDDQPANVVPLARGSPALSMNDFLGAVIDQQERRNAGPDAEIEGYPPPARLVR